MVVKIISLHIDISQINMEGPSGSKKYLRHSPYLNPRYSYNPQPYHFMDIYMLLNMQSKMSTNTKRSGGFLRLVNFFKGN